MGYPTAIAYPSTHQPKIAPAHLATVAALSGAAHPPIDRRYAYCELGAGTGFTTNLLAAANTFAEIHAVDFNADHVAAGRALAEAGALPNAHHHALSFAAATAAADLPMFDFVALHGVWTWVGEAARRDVLAFLASRLRPGGLVYVSYTARPGMDGVVALRRVLDAAGLLAEDLPGPARVARVRAYLERLRLAAPEMGEADRNLDAYGEALARMNEASAQHDFLAPDWSAVFHGSVRDAMASAGLAYLGDADLPMNRPGLAFAAGPAALLSEAGDAGGEALKDLLTRRPFRRDVYRRPDGVDASGMPLGQIRWTLRAAANAPPEVPFPGLRADLLAALAGSLPSTAATLLADATAHPAEIVLEHLSALIVAGHVVPAIGDPPGPLPGPPRLSPFNRAALDLPIGDDDARVLAAPAIGAGVAIDRGTAYLLGALASGGPGGGPGMLARRLAAEGRSITIAGRPVGDAAGLERALAPQFARFEAGDLVRLARLGVVA